MYSREVNVQVLIALLKAHGIRHIVASPGGTNVAFVGSLQSDSYFKVYSAVDERHGAYLACGIALETNDAVVLSCTGATASRNYMPALTEAFYRKLPILVVTSSQIGSRVGHLYAQVTDRSHLPNDIANCSITVRPIRDEQDKFVVERDINIAILALSRHGGGPAHINLETEYCQMFDVQHLPTVRRIFRIESDFKMAPTIDYDAKIAIWIGAHRKFSPAQLEAINRFVLSHNAVVLCDHTSSYIGNKKVVSAIAGSQSGSRMVDAISPDLIIHIGEVSGDYSTTGYLMNIADVWRVSPDGEMRDQFNRLKYIFEMPEEVFFNQYSNDFRGDNSYYLAWCKYVDSLRQNIPDLSFSNMWIAKQMATKIPRNSIVHLAILNSLRSWNNFELGCDIDSSCNVGAFGIDGCTSTLIGASLVAADKMSFLITGDLAFFYDLNAIGNRHIGNNLRILLVNNGGGAEFYRFDMVRQQLGHAFPDIIPAVGHFGNRSAELVKHLAIDLGFVYLASSNKQSFDENVKQFCNISNKPIIFECFTSPDDDAKDAKRTGMINNQHSARSLMSSVIPESVKKIIRPIIAK